jgi:hypothetical protein
LALAASPWASPSPSVMGLWNGGHFPDLSVIHCNQHYSAPRPRLRMTTPLSFSIRYTTPTIALRVAR